VHREISLPRGKGILDVRDKQPLTPHFGQRSIHDLVAARPDGHEFKLDAVRHLLQKIHHMVRLRERERAPPRRDS